MQSVLSHAQTDVSNLQQLMACRIQLNVEDKPLIDEPADEQTLVALITAQLAHIAQKQLVEIRFEYQLQARSLYLLDGLMAAQLHLHAEAYISALAQIQAETAEEANTNTINTNTVERCLNSAFSLAKRDCAQAVNSYAQAGNLARQLNVLSQAVEALSHRSLKGIEPMLDAADAAQLAERLAEQHAEPRAEKPVKTAQNGYWFTKPHQARVLSLNLLDKAPRASTAQSLILTQGTRLIAQPLLNANRLFIPISGNTLESLTAQLSQLIDSLDLSASFPDTDWLSSQGNNWFKRYQAKDKLTLVLMAGSVEELMQEAKAVCAYTEKTQQTPAPAPAQTPATTPSANLAFKTPAGSYFTPTPLGDTGLTFVYPGVGTVYPNMFSDLHSYFPELYRELEREGDLAAMLQAETIYQGTNNTKSAEKDSAEMSLSQLAISGVGASYLFSRLLTRVFNIQPQLALGYSMGEAAMWASLDIWQTPHALINATQNSAIFNQEISGPLLAVRRDWQLNEDAPLVWNSFLVRASRDEINAMIPDFPRVYLAIEQGDTCIIAGSEASCLQLLARLNKRGIASNKVTAMHTQPSQSQHNAIQGLYTLGLKADACETQVRFISAAQQSAVSIDSQSIAKSIADTFCAPLNFTALINTAYQQGARLFVEVGADRQTSTLIDKIGRQLELSADGVQTQEQPILAMACNAKGSDTITSLLKCLAQLISHRVPLSLAPLMPQLAAQSATPVADKTTAKTLAPHSVSTSALGHYSNVFQEGEPL
ncbi:omega-3 polyunsaturated fatty acid synthase PfaB [Shewanella xiamenensis]|uniref:PfaB family protein n=1 Tax=Shewanella xiamenensis TaxID=332186 RepID=UPI001C4F79C8|nr:PfaB family protein [Shewanella xiamenensis]MBW0280829.1 omega-3 polyunsaturated fatty acid synthase PfaB [Shewanella xiamenensis]